MRTASETGARRVAAQPRALHQGPAKPEHCIDLGSLLRVAHCPTSLIAVQLVAVQRQMAPLSAAEREHVMRLVEFIGRYA